ncbi:hypothetical protein DQ354_12345 [Arthrobacter sp. AQ5-06]|nr:hypothetical protein DQ354_12345 [Arthrobacter sp. AQ5-06]
MTDKADTQKKKRVPPQPRAGGAPTNGRYSQLSITRCKNIVGAIELGNYIGTACEYAGIGRSTYHEWVKRGEVELDRVHSLPGVDLEDIMNRFEGKDPDEVDDNTGQPKDKGTVEYMWVHRPTQFGEVEWPYVVFNHLTSKARATAEVRHISNIMSAGRTQWQASGWWLERTLPERYGRRDRLQMSGTAGGEPIRTETVITVEQVNDALEKLMNPDGSD